jgi:phage regulator Rha-like protein
MKYHVTLAPDMNTTSIELSIRDGEPVIDSRTVATLCGIDHKATLQLIRRYQTELESMGTVPFEMEPSNAKGQGGDGPKKAILTEDQATFLITLSRNTATVVRFKAALVTAFSAARRQLEIRDTFQQCAPPMPVVHPAVQFIEVIDALRMRGASTEKTLYSVGNLFQSALAGAYQSNRQVLPMALPPPPDPTTLPLPRPRRGENPMTEESILVAMGDKAWTASALQKHISETQGVSSSTFYRAWNILRGQEAVTKDAKGLWTVAKGGDL